MSSIISVHSFRGGTGKSNISANLAALLALNGKRVAVVDTDIQCPGLHVLFGLNEQQMKLTLNEYLRGECDIEDVAYPVAANSHHAQGLSLLAGNSVWVIPSSINAGEISAILRNGYDVNRLNEGLQRIRKHLALDYLIIDTHPGLNDETLLSIAFSDLLLVVLRLDQQDFQGTAVTVDIARSLDVPELLLVVNQALPRYDFQQVQSQVSRAYDATVASVLPLSEDLVEMQSSDLFALRHPDHPWSRGIRTIVNRLMKTG